METTLTLQQVAHQTAIANAVYHTTSIRVRDPPTTLDKPPR
ncbi:MAG TPA: hypothetical protein VH591_10135 [Ktedonobacterales bacterium]|jgi:CO/xanthine dehydrogenase Mo-binding subunit